MDTKLQRLTVTFDFPVLFTEGAFEISNPALVEAMCRLGESRVHRVLVVLDSHVVEAWSSILPGKVKAYFASHADRLELVSEPIVAPGGEAVKNDCEFVQKLIFEILQARLCRQSFVIAVGGGAVLDAAGLATALVHRGLRLIRIPTTVLAQNDSGVGVKNAINLKGIKNAIGVFSPPFAVINDRTFLRSLSHREWISGISEAFKVAIIRDRTFFDFLASNAAGLCQRDMRAMDVLVRRSAELHMNHIISSGDPFETGSARPLDFGHWSAHKLEAMSDFEILHGEAVGVGILLDCAYAKIQGWLTEDEFASIRSAIVSCGLPVWFDELRRRTNGKLEIFDGLEEFREHLGGELCVTFPRGIGDRLEAAEIDFQAMEQAITRLHTDSACNA